MYDTFSISLKWMVLVFVNRAHDDEHKKTHTYKNSLIIKLQKKTFSSHGHNMDVSNYITEQHSCMHFVFFFFIPKHIRMHVRFHPTHSHSTLLFISRLIRGCNFISANVLFQHCYTHACTSVLSLWCQDTWHSKGIEIENADKTRKMNMMQSLKSVDVNC